MLNNVKVEGENEGNISDPSDFYLSLYKAALAEVMRLEQRTKALEDGLRLAAGHVDSPRVRRQLQRVLGGMKDE